MKLNMLNTICLGVYGLGHFIVGMERRVLGEHHGNHFSLRWGEVERRRETPAGNSTNPIQLGPT